MHSSKSRRFVLYTGVTTEKRGVIGGDSQRRTLPAHPVHEPDQRV